jgi:ribosomal protein S18 acetylase RimI-like enzyme
MVSFRPTTADDFLVIERFARLASSNPGHYSERWGRMGDFGVIAESSGQPVGAAWARLFAWSDIRDPLGSPQFPELAIAVDSAFRGCGVGTTLLRELLVAAGRLGYAAVDLLVERSNFAAIAVYTKLGFKRVGGDARLWMRAAVGAGGSFQES